MDLATLARMYSLTAFCVKSNAEGVSHEESLRPPAGGGASFNWIAGHVLASRNPLLGLVGRPPAFPESKGYGRGESIEPADARPLEEILARFDASQEALLAGLASLPAARLAEPIAFRLPGGLKTVGEALAFFHFHEAYHTGQLGLLRRILGKPGAIA